MSQASFHVVRCGTCGVDRLDPMPIQADIYESGVYRVQVDGGAEAAAYYANHDMELAERLALIGSGSIRGKVIANVGCGAGTFLDLVKGLAFRTIGIEPQKDFTAVLAGRAGLKVVKVMTPHLYDLSNLAVWLRDERPSGLGALPEPDGPANAAFRSQVVAGGRGDRIYAVLERTP